MSPNKDIPAVINDGKLANLVGISLSYYAYTIITHVAAELP